MRVLVTGAAGFVGSHLVPRLRRDASRVIAADREVDVADPRAVEAAVADAQPDAVVHLAAQSSVAVSWRDPLLTYRVNYVGARCVLDAVARAAPQARVLLVGSADEYGVLPVDAAPVTESTPLRPLSPYARAKTAADLLGASRAALGLDVLRLRAFNHSGPGQSETFVLASFARQLAEIESGRREPVLRVGNLDSVRDFLDVADVVEAYALLLDPGVAKGAYNVASGRGLPVGELLERLLAHARVRPEIEVDPERVRPADRSVGDATRLRAATGWAPQVPLDDTLARLLEDWRERVSAA